MKAGIASTRITPQQTLDLAGYAARQQPMLGIHDDIWVRAVVFEDNGHRAAVVSAEILGLDLDDAAAVQNALGSEGFAEGSVVLSCTHTHAAPATQRLRGCGHHDPGYVQFIRQSIIDAIKAAARGLEPVEMRRGSAQCELGVNRRAAGHGGLVLGENPGGRRDPELQALQIRRPSGSVLATLFNYGCHAVTLGPDNRMVSGDWPGQAARTLEKTGEAGLFLQGCCGDVNPRIRDGFDRLAQAAGMVAASVQEAIDRSAPIPAGISCAVRAADLPLQPLPPEDELRARLQQIAEKPREQWDYPEIRDDAWIRDVLEHPEESNRDVLSVNVGALRIGDQVICWLPGEPFSSYSLRLKAVFSPCPAMVTGYSNGNIGYIPDAEAFTSGGYEVTDAYRYYAFRMLEPACDDIIISAFRDMREELF